ncbi:MAG: DNA repair protein RadA [Oligoflexia bacterium]|nr:DNA repair protein RadA [Oligoflexia bacterium]
MAKQKTIFACQNCGFQSPKWLGKCPDCSEWNSFAEEKYSAPQTQESARGLGTGDKQFYTVSDFKSENEIPKSQSTNILELDRVLGGGLVQGSFTLLGGDPGIGKSTLMLQAANKLAQNGKKILYISGEESVHQTQMRAKRLNANSENLFIASETNMDAILSLCEKLNPYLVVIDSIQTVYLPQLQSAPGSVSQVRECAAKLMYLAKTKNSSVLLVGHITKDGSIAGPKVLEHMVDTVLSFEGDNTYQYRILRSLKNRFGPVHEIGVFEMLASGLREVKNPSELFLSQSEVSAPGSTVFCAVEGTRPLLVEVQALATRTNMNMPRRTAIGIDVNRLHLILAILDKHLRLDLYAHDVFVNIVGGFKITEPAADLAVAAALLSSLKNSEIPKNLFFFGELGLTGEVRQVSFPELRLKEAQKMGFKKVEKPLKTIKDLLNIL